MASIPVFLRSEDQPPLEAYTPTAYDPARCLARRTDDDHCDRRWTPFVYGSYQCKSLPVVGSDLCATCRRHEAKGTADDCWHGRMTDATLPADSHIAGSAWFHKKAKWTGVEKPRTRRMEERSDERRLIADVELRRFTGGTVRMDIERLAADNQITGQQLRDMVCRLSTPKRPEGADRINGHDTKEKLCTLIRTLMDPDINEKPKFTVHYPSPVASVGAMGGAGSGSASVASSAAEEEEEIDILKAENAALKAELAALKAKMEKIAAVALGDD